MILELPVRKETINHSAHCLILQNFPAVIFLQCEGLVFSLAIQILNRDIAIFEKP